jgi:hypothetical protein
MKYILTILAALFGCSTHTPDVKPPDNPEIRLSLSLIGPQHMGHACAVDGRVLSAGHIAAPYVNGAKTFPHYTWSDGKKGGWLRYLTHSHSRDLGMMEPYYGDYPDFQYRQETPATVGQHVTWYEYNYIPGNVLSTVRREGVVERLQAGHIIVDAKPNPGASGSCLFNARNEVIGIVTWSIFDSGVAVDLTGQWWPFTEEE